MDNLPESIVLNILSYLPVKERCICGRVCKQWRRISNDKSLWRHVDLLPYRLNLKKTWKLIRSHLSDCLLSIKFRGFFDQSDETDINDYADDPMIDAGEPKDDEGVSKTIKSENCCIYGTKWKVSTVSNAALEDLQTRCPNLQELVFFNIPMDGLGSSNLPKTLVSLTIDGCWWNTGWMKDASLPHLQALILDNTVRIDRVDVEEIIKFYTLEKLSLNGCYRIGFISIQMIAENLKNLVSLELSGTDNTDLPMYFVSRNLKFLRTLNISNCKELTNEAVEMLASGSKDLEVLDVSLCPKIDQGCVGSLLKFKSLKKLRYTMELSEQSRERLCHLI